MVEEALIFCDATGVAVGWSDGDDLGHACGVGRVGACKGLRIPVTGSLSGLCLQARMVQRCADSDNDPQVNREGGRRIRARSMRVVPQQHDGTVIGVPKTSAECIFA